MNNIRHSQPRVNSERPLLRVTRKQPCPICGHADWCSVSADRALAFCMRISAGSIKRAANGASIHRLSEASPPARPTRPRPTIKHASVPPPPRASVEHCDGIYALLLRSHLVLSREHRAALVARGLDDAEIARNGYVSTPTPEYARYIARALALYDLRGVPGFYRVNGEWRMADYGAGFFVPVRDERLRTVSLQIRRDEAAPRYLWLSSSGRPEGTTSGSPLHFAKAHLLRARARSDLHGRRAESGCGRSSSPRAGDRRCRCDLLWC